MKHKKNKLVDTIEHVNNTVRNEKQHEIYKAVAQAWHSHFNKDKFATCEFDARRRNFKGNPSRFKLEAMKNKRVTGGDNGKNLEWRFSDSLWDSYEIVAMSKRLETGLVLSNENYDLQKIGECNRVFRKRKESKKSLRSLFNVMSSRRFSDDEVYD